jgi:hypothetical protein
MPSFISTPIIVEGAVIGYQRTPLHDDTEGTADATNKSGGREDASLVKTAEPSTASLISSAIRSVTDMLAWWRLR